jgi:hypothetical protein
MAESRLGQRATRRRAAVHAFDAALDRAAAALGAADFEPVYAAGRPLALGEAAREALALANGMLARPTGSEFRPARAPAAPGGDPVAGPAE